MNSQQFGRWAEGHVKDFLIAQGLVFIKENYRSRFGEIDLIMQDDGVLVFVEVRARIRRDYGSGASSVTVLKQQKIIKTAALYIQNINMHNRLTMRFDVVSMDGTTHALTWIKNAFY